VNRKQTTVDPSTVESIPLFASVPRRRRRHVARLADEVGVAAGARLTRQGGYAQEFFVVVSGTADVYRDDQRVGRLEAGEFFGEVGLLGPRWERDGRRDVPDAPARARAAPVPRAPLRRPLGRGAHPRRRRAARVGSA
jgi:CRP-like cAMP-binding protein